MRIVFLCISLLLFGFKSNSQNLPYVNQTDVGLLFGDEKMKSFSIKSFNGVILDKLKKVNLGFIIGIDVYQPITLIPLAPSIKYLFNGEPRSSLYLSLTAGYAFSGLKNFSDNQDSDGGVFVNPTLGFRFKTKRKAAFNLDLGYKIQKASITTYSNNFNSNPRFRNQTVDEYTFKRISLVIGLSF